MKTILEKRKTGLSLVAIALLAVCAGPRDSFAGKLNPSSWRIYDYSGSLGTNLTGGSPVPPTGLHIVSTGISNSGGQTNGQSASLSATNQLTNLTDNNPGTYATLSTPSVLWIDMGQTNTVDRLFLGGNTGPNLTYWPTQADTASPPLGLINVSVGSSPSSMTWVGSWDVPWDAGNPVNTEVDLRFSPMAGRYVEVQLVTNNIYWGTSTTNWPGYVQSGGFTASTPPGMTWNVGEVELYGFVGPMTKLNAVVLPAVSAHGPNQNTSVGPLAIAASDLSYYLGELTGLPHPIVSPSQSNQYPGTLYVLKDLSSLAPNYNTMMANIANGTLPTNLQVTASGNQIQFSGWPWRCVAWGVWEFLERQGVRWVYPDAHGDCVPTGGGVGTNMLPLTVIPSAVSIYANFDCNSLQPWHFYWLQTVRQEWLYPWRNRWNSSQNPGALGGYEIPVEPSPGGTVQSQYSDGFSGYPHTFNSVMPTSILASHTNWWGWTTTNGSPVESDSSPTFIMDDPTLITWVATKMTNWATVQPLACTTPLNYSHVNRAYQMMPMDSCTYSQDPLTLVSNLPPQQNGVPWVSLFYGPMYSVAYYSFVNAVANQVQQMKPSAVPMVGALAYADVFAPPAGIPVFPTNVQVEVCMYGSPNLAMSAPANAGMKAAFDGWHSACSHLCTYDYCLLHTDYIETDPRLPVPLVAGTVDRAQYLASIGALDGGCQANFGSLPYNPWSFYAYPRIRWNTNQTASQLEQEFFNGYFREAAAPMLAYYQAAENWQFSNNVSMYYRGYAYNLMPSTYPVSVLNVMKTNLAAAKLLATNWWVVNRVADMNDGFNFILANCPAALIYGTNFLNKSISSYPVLNPTTNTTALSMVGWNELAGGNWAAWYGGDYVSVWGSGASTSWFYWSQAWMQQTYNIPAGTYRVDVSAYAANASWWPVMNFYFGPTEGIVTVNTTNSSTYSFTTTIPTSGLWDMVVTFNNGGGTVNLGVTGIKITKQ